MNEKTLCEFCGNIYTPCPNCEANGIFKWRLHYCLMECFKRAMRGEMIMRAQYDSKMYKIKEFDLEKDEFILLTLEGDLKISFDDEKLQGFTMPKSDFKQIKDFKQPIKKSTKTKKEPFNEVVEKEGE